MFIYIICEGLRTELFSVIKLLPCCDVIYEHHLCILLDYRPLYGVLFAFFYSTKFWDNCHLLISSIEVFPIWHIRLKLSRLPISISQDLVRLFSIPPWKVVLMGAKGRQVKIVGSILSRGFGQNYFSLVECTNHFSFVNEAAAAVWWSSLEECILFLYCYLVMELKALSIAE